MMIDRRDALAGLAGMFGAGLFAPIARAMSAPTAAALEGPPSASIFTPQQRALMTALSERVIPTTDTPGAIAAGVPQFIEKLLADWALPDERGVIVAGLDTLEARSKADFKVSAAKAGPERQDQLLTLAMNDQVSGGKTFFQAFRQLVVTGYYTSEIGFTQEREWIPVPGRYDGAYPVEKAKKVFSA